MTPSEIFEAVKHNHEEGGWRYFNRRFGGKGSYDIWDAKEGCFVTRLLTIDPTEKMEDDNAS